MPLIVDKEAVRMEILMAFQRCIDSKPLTNVSLRDIAAEANMSHAKLLNYFDSKEELLVSYVRYTRDFMSQKCLAWFNEHDRADYGADHRGGRFRPRHAGQALRQNAIYAVRTRYPPHSRFTVCTG